MKKKRQLILMIGSTLIILMAAGIFGNTVTNAFFSNSTGTPTPTDTSAPTPTITNTALPSPSDIVSPSPTPEPVDPTTTLTPTDPPVTIVPPSDTPEITPTPEYYETNVIIVKVNTLNVRSSANASSSKNITGKIYYGFYAMVVGEEGQWLKINSGDLKEQFIAKEDIYHDDPETSPSQYVMSGYEAALFVDENKGCEATILRTTNLRQGPCISEDYARAATKGEKFVVRLTESTEDWLCVELDEFRVAYIKPTDAQISFTLDTGLTNEQVRMNSFAGKLEAMLKSDKNKRIENLPITNRFTDGSLPSDKAEFLQNYQMSALERDFFAAMIEGEVGGHPYSAKLACANVVINRLLNDASWTGGKTVTSVITMPYQFAGANPFMTDWQIDEEKLAIYLRRVGSSCYQAVDEAMAGVNNIPNYLFFQSTSSAHSEKRGYPVLHYTEFTYIGDTYFYNGYYNAY